MSDFYTPPTVEELLEEFQEMEDWDERFDYLVDLGKELPKLSNEQQTEGNLVKGCMSTVWLYTTSPDSEPDTMMISADSDSLIVKGLIVVLLSYYSGRTAKEILDRNPDELFEQLGLSSHLSPQRRNGLFSMVKRLRELAAEKLSA
jgi:cysteine desulfuration protein SufE